MNDPKAQPFVTDMKEIQRRAREHVEKGAVTPAYRGDVETAVRLLNEALATELICVLRYRRHHYMAAGIHYQAIADEFMEHSVEEQRHADQIADRIRQLGGAPDFDPKGLLTRGHSQYSQIGCRAWLDDARSRLPSAPALRNVCIVERRAQSGRLSAPPDRTENTG